MTQANTVMTTDTVGTVGADTPGTSAPVPTAPVRTSASTRDVRAVRLTTTVTPVVTQVAPRTGLHIRSAAMLLLDENLARARMREAEKQAEELRRAQRVLVARRSQRRARQAARQAWLARTTL